MDKKLLTIKEASGRYSIKPARLREMCHAKGQRFAVQIVKGGNLLIDPVQFEKWLKCFYA